MGSAINMRTYKRILYAIVTFREKFWLSDSFTSFYNSYKIYNKGEVLNLYIFDNTDTSDWNLELPNLINVRYKYTNDKNNPGISFAYNTIAQYSKDNNFDYIVFLDQDTKIPKVFYKIYTDFALTNQEFYVPQIYSQNKLVSPSQYINYRNILIDKLQEATLPLRLNSCINTGIMIRTDIFFLNDGYNQKLRLDFCDHEFIGRLSKFVKQMQILPIRINQNFSFVENTFEQDLFRYKIFLKDMKAYAQLQKKQIIIFFNVDLRRLISLTARHRSLTFFKIRFNINFARDEK